MITVQLRNLIFACKYNRRALRKVTSSFEEVLYIYIYIKFFKQRNYCFPKQIVSGRSLLLPPLKKAPARNNLFGKTVVSLFKELNNSIIPYCAQFYYRHFILVNSDKTPSIKTLHSMELYYYYKMTIIKLQKIFGNGRANLF